MQISWLGHSCFLLISDKGTRIVADPFDVRSYSNQLTYPPIDVSADVVTMSHTSHGDHNYADGVRDRSLVKSKLKETVFKDVRIYGVGSYHDRSNGAERGPNTIFVFEIDGMTVVHLGDLGHVIGEIQQRAIESPVDVLLCPIGGHYTIDANEADESIAKLHPRIVIPMHYKTAHCDFPIDGIETFIVGRKNVRKLPWFVTIDRASLPQETEIWVMDYRK
jgi:L-ascorbate metabolism protein UlaG (beta-lactamase superfamily)